MKYIFVGIQTATRHEIYWLLSVVFVSLGTKKEDGEGEGYLSVVHGARHRGEVAQHHLANKYFWSRQIFLRFTKNIFALYKKYFCALQKIFLGDAVLPWSCPRVCGGAGRSWAADTRAGARRRRGWPAAAPGRGCRSPCCRCCCWGGGGQLLGRPRGALWWRGSSQPRPPGTRHSLQRSTNQRRVLWSRDPLSANQSSAPDQDSSRWYRHQHNTRDTVLLLTTLHTVETTVMIVRTRHHFTHYSEDHWTRGILDNPQTQCCQ